MRIERIYLQSADDWVRLCADVSSGQKQVCLWFAVPSEHRGHLVCDRADAFAAALIRLSLLLGEDLVCGMPLSAELLYQLNEYVIPELAATLNRKPIVIRAAAEKRPVQTEGKIGVGFSGGADSLYSVRMNIGPDGLYPLDYLCVINAGVFEGSDPRQTFLRAVKYTETFAEKLGLSTLPIDTNLHLVLPEGYLETYSLRLLSSVMAVGGLLGTYLLSSGNSFEHYKRNAADLSDMDLLLTPSLSTRALSFICFGIADPRIKKLAVLADWPPAWDTLHPCFIHSFDKKNCGHCKKCRRDMIALWAMDRLDRFSAVYDLEKAAKMHHQNIAFLLANRRSPLCREVLDLMAEKNIPIPSESIRLSRHFTAAMDNLKKKGERP